MTRDSLSKTSKSMKVLVEPDDCVEVEMVGGLVE